MGRDKGCASAAATVDSETAVVCPKAGGIFLPQLKCISLAVDDGDR